MDEDNYNELFRILDEFTSLYAAEEKKIPIEYNLVKVISPNENAHSRILAQLLAISDANVASFFQFLGGSFANIVAAGSVVACEKDRIDISIKTANGCGVIIENKICGAIDQDRQIERYVEVFKNAGIAFEKIYVLYLTDSGGSPASCSLIGGEEGRKDGLNERYKEINYRDHILPWLKHCLLPTCQYRNQSLIAAIEHYINFLEDRFKLLDNYKNMNDKLEDLLENKLEIAGKDLGVKLKTISAKLAEFKQLNDTAERMQREYFIGLCDGWYDKISKEYPSSVRKDNYKNATQGNQYYYISVMMEYKEEKFACSLGKDNISDDTFYTGISLRGTGKIEKKNEVIELCKDIMPCEKVTKRWYVWNSCTAEEVYLNFKRQLEQLKKIKGVTLL